MLKLITPILYANFILKRNLSTYEMTFFLLDKNPRLDIDIGFTVGQVAEINGKLNKKTFLSVEVALDEAHFLKSKHSYNTDVAKELLVRILIIYGCS